MIAATAIAASAVIVAVAGAELLHWRASKSAPPMDAAPSRSCGIVALGFPSRQNARLHPIQRCRTELGSRSLASADRGFLVFTGGPSRGKISDAQTMAACAARLRAPSERLSR